MSLLFRDFGEWFHGFFKGLFDWVYFKKCYLCGEISAEKSVCINCIESLKQKLKPPIPFKTIGETRIYSAFIYQGEIKKLIRGIKFHNKKDFAPIIAQLLFELWKDTEIFTKEIVIIPMPSHKKRIKERKYNHMELIAEEFAKLCGYSINTGLVSKIKNTKPQYKLNKIQRAENLKDAFRVAKEFHSGGEILLLDDICATGSTMGELLKALNLAGIKKIKVLSISRT